MKLGLKGKKVVITGGSRGIGLAIAESFLAEGALVTLLARDTGHLDQARETLTKEFGVGSVNTIACDCSLQKDLASAAQSIQVSWITFDILVLNVGNGVSSAAAVPVKADWDQTWVQNFESARASCEALLPLLQGDDPNILFISSIAGLEAIGAPSAYSTAKAAVNAFAKNMSRKLAPDTRVNVVAPGNVFFEGGRWEELQDAAPEKVAGMLENNVPMKRFGTPQEIADVVVFVCSARAAFVTGATIVVDGGQTTS